LCRSIIRRKERGGSLSGAVLLYSYGAYGFAYDSVFDADRLCLLRRGAAFAIAHVRGGGERGRHWHQAGARLSKKRGVADLVDVANFLRSSSSSKSNNGLAFRAVALEGRSAGGYLLGAAVNAAPSLFAAALLEVKITPIHFH